MDPTPIKVQAFTSAENFAQFNNKYWNSYPAAVQGVLSGFRNQYKAYAEACCNKRTWLKILNAALLDLLKNNSGNQELKTTIKEITNCSKIMFFQDNNLIAEF